MHWRNAGLGKGVAHPKRTWKRKTDLHEFYHVLMKTSALRNANSEAVFACFYSTCGPYSALRWRAGRQVFDYG